MFIYKKFMKEFDDDMLNIILKPKLKLKEKKFIQVIYNECYFYTNNRWKRIWIKKKEYILYSKYLEYFIIVSGFLYLYYRSL